MNTTAEPEGTPPERPIWQLPAAVVSEMALLGTTRSVPARTIIINEGDPADAFYILLRGRVRVYLADGDGREVLLNEHGPGEHVGEMLLDGGVRSASVMTTEPCRFSVLTREQLETYLASHPVAAMALIRMLIGRVRILTRTVGSLSLLDVYGRVAGLLLDMAVEEPDGRLALPGRPTQRELARRVGASREMVGRILRDLREGGYIEIVDHRIILLRRPPRSEPTPE